MINESAILQRGIFEPYVGRELYLRDDHAGERTYVEMSFQKMLHRCLPVEGSGKRKLPDED